MHFQRVQSKPGNNPPRAPCETPELLIMLFPLENSEVTQTAFTGKEQMLMRGSRGRCRGHKSLQILITCRYCGREVNQGAVKFGLFGLDSKVLPHYKAPSGTMRVFMQNLG